MLNSSTLTPNEITNFFTNCKQLGIPERTVKKLKDDGIEHPCDLVDFDKDTLQQVAENLRKAPTRKTDDEGDVIYLDPYVLSAKSYKRMLETAELMRFYEAIGREIDADIIRYETVTKDFMAQKELAQNATGGCKSRGPEDLTSVAYYQVD
jgi:hypothetical protein